MTKPEWWEEDGGYYDKTYIESHVLGDSKKTVSLLANLLWKELGLRRGARVLDVGCGIGHVGIELARRGCEVTGIDINRLFLRHARMGAREAGVVARFQRADMRALPFSAEFESVFAVGPTLGFFAKESDNARVFSEMARVLRPGGRVLIDQWKWRPHLKKRSWKETRPDGSVEKVTAWDDEGGRAHIMTEHRGKRVHINYRKYNVEELSRNFEAAGLSIASVLYLDYWEFLPVPPSEAHRIIVTAEKIKG